MIHLDTSFLIVALVRGSPQDRKLREWLRASEPLGMSAVAWAEFLCGPVDGRHVELAARIIAQRVPFEEQDAASAAQLFNQSGRRRGSLAECMIAATAIYTTPVEPRYVRLADAIERMFWSGSTRRRWVLWVVSPDDER